jgi:hypothetical protein
LSIIYYTANAENIEFENKIIDNLKLQAGGITIISVSRKSIDLGKNICVGEKPICYSSELKQILIGLKEAKTEFCLAAESDCLYPPDYFQFIPEIKDRVYRYNNIKIHFEGRDKFWKKSWVEAGQICGRDFWIKSIEKVLSGQKDWEPIKVNPPFVFDTKDKYVFSGENPILYFKTRQGIGFKTGFIQGSSEEIPYWGTAEEVRKKYL